jgi:hypothetical protein
MTQPLKAAKLICKRCRQTFEWMDDGETEAGMPDGAFLYHDPNEWVCGECLKDGE